MAKRKLTPIKQQYRKERRRVQRSMRRLEKQGYVLPDDLLPSIPKKITQASINRLKKITSESIYKKSKKLDFETGEITPGIVARDKARSERAKEAARRRAFKQYTKFPSAADIIINNYRIDVIGRFPKIAGPILTRWLDILLSRTSKEDVANMLETAASHGVIIDYKVAYNRDTLMSAIADFMDYLGNVELKKDIIDMLEFEEDWEAPE
ncbi:hypothetical protein AAGT75_005288 [Escherichia coli]